jgi:hypothetical protein
LAASIQNLAHSLTSGQFVFSAIAKRHASKRGGGGYLRRIYITVKSLGAIPIFTFIQFPFEYVTDLFSQFCIAVRSIKADLWAIISFLLIGAIIP